MPHPRYLVFVAAFALSAVTACSSGGGGGQHGIPPGGSGGSGGSGGAGGSGGSGGVPIVDLEAPVVAIASPVDHVFVDGATVEIRGTATDDVAITSLSIAANFERAVPVAMEPGPSVAFAIPIELREDENVAVVHATDAAGNETSATVVFFAAPPNGPARVVSLEVDPPAVEAGGVVTISWKVAGTPPVELWLEPIGDVTGQTSITLQPTRDIEVALEARNAEGTDRSVEQIVVDGGPHVLRPAGGVMIPGASQRFWVENAAAALAWSDGTAGKTGITWTAPEEPGTYEVWAETPLRRETVQVEVRELLPSLNGFELAGGQSIAAPNGGASLHVAHDGAMWLSGDAALKSVLHMPAGGTGWEILGAPLDAAPLHLARDPATGTVYAASGLRAAWVWGGAGWTPLPDLPGNVLGLRWHDGLFALADGAAGPQIHRLDGSAWNAVGPALPVNPRPDRFLQRASGNWLAWSQSFFALADLLEWTPGDDAWTSIATIRGLASVVEAPDASLFLGGQGVRQLVGTTLTERGGGLPENARVASLHLQGDSMFACGSGIVWRAIGTGDFAPIVHPAAEVLAGDCTVRTDAEGRVYFSGAQGTWRWAEDIGWEALGGRGLPAGANLITHVASGPDGQMALAARGGFEALGETPFYLLVGGVWHPVAVPVPEGGRQPAGKAIAWDGSAWAGATSDAVYRIDPSQRTAEELPPVGVAGPAINGVLARDGVVFVTSSEGAFRLAPGAAQWEPLGGTHFVSSAVIDTAGTVWIAGANQMSVLPAGSGMWLTRNAVDYPYSLGASFSAIAEGADGAMWALTADGPMTLARGAGTWRLAGLGYSGATFGFRSLAVGARTWIASSSGVTELVGEGAWVPVQIAGLPNLTPRTIEAGPDGSLYVATNQFGLIRYVP